MSNTILSYSYGCVMADLPNNLSCEIIGYASAIPNVFLKTGNEDAPTGRAEDVHVTVKYGVLTNNVDEVRDVIYGKEPIIATLGRTSVFVNEDQIVLKISVESLGLKRLNQEICRKLQTKDTYRTYSPHVTIAYLVKNEKNPYYYRTFCGRDFEGRKFEINKVLFSAPDGNKSIIHFDGDITGIRYDK